MQYNVTVRVMYVPWKDCTSKLTIFPFYEFEVFLTTVRMWSKNIVRRLIFKYEYLTNVINIKYELEYYFDDPDKRSFTYESNITCVYSVTNIVIILITVNL